MSAYFLSSSALVAVLPYVGELNLMASAIFAAIALPTSPAVGAALGVELGNACMWDANCAGVSAGGGLPADVMAADGLAVDVFDCAMCMPWFCVSRDAPVEFGTKPGVDACVT